jgi:hypothetical protein
MAVKSGWTQARLVAEVHFSGDAAKRGNSIREKKRESLGSCRDIAHARFARKPRFMVIRVVTF